MRKTVKKIVSLTEYEVEGKDDAYNSFGHGVL